MAVGGGNRQEIEDALSERFPRADASAILDQVLGAD
jgi:hypothetical protein